MHRRHTPILTVAAVLALTAILGYAVPRARPDSPVRILLRNSGGTVVFDHRAHAGYGVKCMDCHHAGKTEATEIPCGYCHPADFNAQYVAEHRALFKGKVACFACHHLEFAEPIFDHRRHMNIASGCTDCHHGPPIEARSQACANCHQQARPTEPAAPGRPNLRDAVHERCRDCHQDLYDQGLAGCASCHSKKDQMDYNLNAPASCRHCHDKPQAQLVPQRKDAFHGQCMGCHEKRHKGPYRNQPDVKDCKRCHLP